MSEIGEARKALVKRILKGDGETSLSVRRAAFNAEPPGPLIEKVAKYANRVSDEDIAAAKLSGFSEDQIFEIVVCAAVGQATRQYDQALAALNSAIGKE